MPFSHSTLGAVPLFCVFSRGNTTENGSVSAQRSTWKGTKHLKIEGLCQFFDIWKNCFRNLQKICLLMEFCCHSAKHFHIHVLLCVWSCNIDVRHVQIFVTSSSFYVLLQSDGKARCFFGIKMPTNLYRKPELSSSGPRLGWHVPPFLRHEAGAKPKMIS